MRRRRGGNLYILIVSHKCIIPRCLFRIFIIKFDAQERNRKNYTATVDDRWSTSSLLYLSSLSAPSGRVPLLVLALGLNLRSPIVASKSIVATEVVQAGCKKDVKKN
jgi:hypothetical protein